MPSNARVTSLTRRGLLTAGGALGLGAALAACGTKSAGGGDAADTGQKAGPWKFTDDRGTAVEAKSTPKNIVAFTGMAAALKDFGIEVKGVFGPTYVEDPKTKEKKPDVQAGDLDIAKVKVLGNVWGEFKIEEYLKLQPELLITDMWEKNDLWYVPAEQKDKILKIAPSVALWAADKSMPAVLQRHADLAASLGADVKTKQIQDDKARFEAAAERVRQAAKGKKDIKVLIGSGSPDLFYVSTPVRPTDTVYFKELGVNIVTPTKLDQGGWFEGLSWENVDKYQADIIMLDNRTSALQPEALKAKPTWAALPAVKAGQVIPRVTEPIYSYAKCAPLLEDLAKALENAKKVS
ncbi:ABC transporter substrate-binding protein [Streptomyces sp. P9(2023)]|uniref:ABC transporter substrate-binding protein n=1 Tax=Streptomyces sp. P9(2023) TaxID=3064394 RepID=UPI0028F41945|nr:ABC transporter substrate-binding protein [Streptomyces sp. P9(2023)]MDT9689171.1 ABC transporter substrate-binding protein [Streptomyces sp. P9(2023)]